MVFTQRSQSWFVSCKFSACFAREWIDVDDEWFSRKGRKERWLEMGFL